jgi:RNA polymerase sigma factor (sigma-70 family)
MRCEAVSVETVAKQEPVRSDAELLAAFGRQRDRAALAELIRRHHRLVLGVCQQVLGHTHDAEDAYQATFLVLLHKSQRIRRSASLASWLYGVAFRVASRIRQRRARSRPLDFELLGAAGRDPLVDVMLRDQQAALHAAIVRLPEPLRRPVVLRYLLGQSNLEVAQQLAISEAAVESRLKRAKVRLRRNLTQQGVTMAAALATLPLAVQTADAAEPLVALTVARCLAANSPVPSARRGEACGEERATTAGRGEVPVSLKNLVTEELTSMFTKHFTQAMLVVGLGAAATGLILLPKLSSAQPAGDGVTVTQQQQDSPVTPAVEVQLAPARSTEVTRDELSMNVRPATEHKILEALERTTRIDFVDEPLADAISFLKELHGIQILVDQAALDELGISTDATVNLQVSDISLRSALKHLLRNLGLTYTVRDEVMLITTPEANEKQLFVRLYPYRPEWPITLEQLKDAIRYGIARDTWDDVGGVGVVQKYTGGLMVSHTHEIHEQIVDLLVMLSRQAASQKAGKSAPLPVP